MKNGLKIRRQMPRKLNVWEKVDNDTQRMAVYGGWIVEVVRGKTSNLIFVPDPNHYWDIKD